MKQNNTFQEGVADLKYTTTPLTTQPDNSQTLDLSNEVLQDLVSQGAAKLRSVKVGGQKKKAQILGLRLQFSRFYVVTSAARVRYPAGADFEGLQLCSPLSYKDV